MRAEIWQPAISVIIGAYNVERFVAAAIQSALSQTFGDFELIVADDGSTDDTLAVVREFTDSRISVLAFPHRGPTWLLNDCVARSRGRYLAFLDGDDVWAPRRLERHVEYMDARPGADLTFSLSRIIDENGRDTGITSRSFQGPLPFHHLLADNLMANGSAVMIRRTALEQAGLFDTAMEASYDHDCWLRIALLRPGNILCIPEVLTFYRRRRGQITGDWRRMERASHHMAEKFHVSRPREAARAERRRRENLYRYLAMIAFESGAYAEGLKLLLRSAAASPLHFLLTLRSYKTALALAAGLLLPQRWLRRLQEFAARVSIYSQTGSYAIGRSSCPPTENATASQRDLPDPDPDNRATRATV
jgi:glycosyltransferase involved in cell wall biosynthesis